MKKRRISKRLLALFLVMVMIITMTPIEVFAEEGGSTQAEEGSLGENLANALGAESEKMVEVKFALPEGLSEDEAAEITLPETQMIASGTLIAALPMPEWQGKVFLGWYYDAPQTKEADMYDAVERNLTLYPSFTSAQNYEDQFRINYISDQDVEPDFEIRLVSYGLGEEKVRELLKVTDLSKVEGEESFVLEQVAPDLETLIPEEETYAKVLEILTLYESGELEGSLTDALAGLTVESEEETVPDNDASEADAFGVTEKTEEPERLLDDATISEIAAWYAPDEAGIDKAEKIMNLLAQIEKAGLDTANVSYEDLTRFLTPEELEEIGLVYLSSDEEDMTGVSELNSESDAQLDEETKETDARMPSQIYTDDKYDLNIFTEPVLSALPAIHYILRPAGGNWNRGDLHQTEILDTAHLRFWRDGKAASEHIIFYNITVHQEDFNNMQLMNDIIFLPASEVEGVDLDGGLFTTDASTNGDMSVSKNEDSGILSYSGSEKIGAGTTVAVYDGTLYEDGTVDGSVGYFNISEVLGGGEYAYGSPDFTDVVFTPDVIPVKDDGSFDDGAILLTADQLNFTGVVYETLGLSESTVVETGDFLAVYTGDISDPDNVELTGYGCITSVEESGADLLVSYDPVDEGTLQRSADMYMHVDNVPVPLTEEELEEIGRQLSEEIENSEFMEESSEYISGLIMKKETEKPDSEYGQALQEIKFQREDGGEISLEEVQELAAGGKVEVKRPIKPSVQVGLSLQHFDGTGVRAEAAAQFEMTIHLNDDADIKITVVAMLELEVALGLTCKFEIEWRKAWIFPYIYDMSGHVGLHAGIYTGLGVTVTVQTAGAEDDSSVAQLMPKDEKTAAGGERGKAYLDLKKFGQGLESIAKAAKKGEDGLHVSSIPGAVKSAKDTNGKNTKPNAETDEMHNSVGGGFEEKYANFIQESDAEYVSLLNKELITFQLPSDPLHILAISLGINFVVGFKLNVMLGASLTYGNAKEIAANFTIFHPSSETTEADLETPNFQVDFFIFGMVGIRAGIQFDLRVGVLTTKLASIGITAEVGVYLEFFGYFYVSYKWEAGSGSGTEMFGSLLLQAGMYLDINFKVQMGDGKLQKDVDLYDVRFPLLSLGDEFCALDFEIEEDDESLNIDIQEGSSAKVPDELFDIQFLELDTGDIDSDNMDRDDTVNNGGTSFTSMGIPYTQMDEAYFHVDYTPLGKDYTDATAADAAKGRFLYDPRTNTITAKPAAQNNDELWGEFTFTWYQGGAAKTKSQLNYGAGFGLNTRMISRTVKVHWKGTPMTAAVRVYMEQNGIGGKEAIDDQISFYERDLERYEYMKALNGTEGEPPVFQPNALLSYFTENSSETFDGIVDNFYLIDLNGGLGTRFPGYELYFIVAPYDPEVLTAYTNMYNEAVKSKADQATLESLKRRIERYKETKGFSFADYQDEVLYFMMRKPKTEVDLYYVEADYAADWYFEYSNLRKRAVYTSLAAESVPFAQGTNIMESTPQTVLDMMKDPGYNYVYSYKYNEKLWDKTMPKLDGGTYLSVSDRTVFPCQNTLVFIQAVPKTFRVTWMYDDGAVTNKAAYTSYARQPKVPTRSGQEFQSYWVDEDGKHYGTSFEMPAKDLVLTPVFVGKTERTVTWVLDKGTTSETKTTKVKAGTNPLSACPFSFDSKEHVVWYTDPDDAASMVKEDFEMPDSDITLYGKYFFNCSWVMYDTGNNQYTELTSVSSAPVFSKVLENLPEKVSSYLTDKRYTYSYYRIYETDLAKAKANKSKWGIVYGSTVFYPYDTTYILQRSPVMVNVTWKYDDGDVTTSHWVGRALTEPKAAARTGYDFAYWADENGKKYVSGSTRPPYTDLTLYPHFTEHPYQTNWVLYDTGNGQYVELTSEQTALQGQKVLENLPEKVSSYLTDKRYTYSYYRIYETDLAKVKANKSKWGIVYGSTVFYPYDTTYILQRSPVMVNVTWKYDDGDVVTTNWVGRRLTAPKEISRKGYDFTGWADADGKTYSYPPYNDLTLYPRFVEHEHTWDDGSVTTAATCVSTGVRAYICTECGKTKTEEIPINPDNHTGETEVRDAVEATCTAEGYTGDTWCKSCGAKLADGEVIAKLPHTSGKAVHENEVAATCAKEGSYDEVIYCSVCGVELSRTTETIAKIAHSWNEGEITKSATCTEKGTMVYLCTECGETKTEEIPIDPDAHDWGDPEYTWAEDYTYVTASRVCGHNSAHVETETVTDISMSTTATCTEAGQNTYSSAGFENSTFAAQTTTVPQAALGHDWEKVVTDPSPIYYEEEPGEEEEPLLQGEATEEEEWRECIGWKPGTTTRTCRRCGATETAVVKIRPYIIQSGLETPNTSFTIEDEYVLRRYTTASDVLNQINNSYSLYAFYSSTGTQASMDSFWVDGAFSFADSADASKVLADYLEAGSLTVKLVFTPEDTDTFAVVEDVGLTINIYPAPKYNTYLRRGPSLRGYDERATSGSDTYPAFVEVYWLEYIANRYGWTTMKEISPEKIGMEWYYAEAYSYTAEQSNGSVAGTSIWTGVVQNYGTTTSSDLLYVTGNTPISEVISKLKDGTRNIICSFSFTPNNTDEYLPSTGYINFYQKWNTSWWEHYTLTWMMGEETLKTETVFKGALIEPPEVDNVCYWMMSGSELTANAVMPASDTIITGMEHVWGAPEWFWTEDYTAATATFTCDYDESHTRNENAVITSATDEETGNTVYTATVNLDGTEYTNTQTVDASEPKFQRAVPEPTEEPMPERAEEPAEESAEEPAEEPVAEPTEEPVVESAEDPVQEPAGEPVAEPAGGPVQELVEESAEEPAEEPVVEPAEEPVQEPAEEPAEESAEEPAKESAKETTKELTEEAAEEPVAESAEDPVQEPVGEPLAEPAEEPVQEPVGEPAEESAEEPSEELAEEPAEEAAEEPVVEPAGGLVQELAEESVEELDDELAEEPVPRIFTGNVRIKLVNNGDVKENDKVEFEAVVNGELSLVSICWQKWMENEKKHEWEWVTIKEGNKVSIKATVADAAEKYRVVLIDAEGRVCAEADVKFPKISHTPGKAVRENEATATCAKEGSYDEVIYCSVCGEELSRETKAIEKLAHTPGKAVRENEATATCAKEGSYDEVIYCSVCGKELSRETKAIEKLAHTPGKAVRENEATATCATEGSYDEVIYCSVCGKELSRETKAIEKLAHTLGKAVRENEVSATSEKEGSYDEVVYCTECGKELKRTTKSIATDEDN